MVNSCLLPPRFFSEITRYTSEPLYCVCSALSGSAERSTEPSVCASFLIGFVESKRGAYTGIQASLCDASVRLRFLAARSRISSSLSSSSASMIFMTRFFSFASPLNKNDTSCSTFSPDAKNSPRSQRLTVRRLMPLCLSHSWSDKRKERRFLRMTSAAFLVVFMPSL